MNKFVIFSAAALLALLTGCQKQQTEAERNAEIERQVNERFAAERQAEEQQRLAQRQAELDAREKELADKERVAANTPEPGQSNVQDTRGVSGGASPASYSMFYTKLEPFGVWRETSTYGYVWQPREAEQSRTWRPYTNGRWVYTDAGWTWISEEPFGWAAYHYGRWTRLRGIGWVWVPGEEWAPAWVAWRTNNDYVGWAPLPPEAQFERRTGIQNWADNYYEIGPEQYCFVPIREIGSKRIERAVVPPEQNVMIVNQTTNVTNITYNNTTVVNQGPNYDQLRTRSQQPIERLRLERRTTVNMATENPLPVVRGEVVEMPAPVIARAQPADRPPTVKERVAQTIVEYGREGIAEDQAARQARAKMKSEATPPPNAPPKTFVKPAAVAVQPGTTSPSATPAVSPSERSTFTPVPAAASPMQTRSATRFARPTQTPVAKPMQTPTSSVSASPHFTPFHRAQATITPAASATATATAAVTARPVSTPAPTPRATFSPRTLPPQFSPPPSASPTFSQPTATPPRFGRAAQTKEERKAQEELRKQERAERKKERSEASTPVAAATATATASVSASPPGAPSEAHKDHKKKKRPGEPETLPQTTATASPSGTP